MIDDECKPVVVSRRICAPAHDIFQILADPVRHLELDGSESLRGAVSATMITGVGDIFVMKMHFSRLGDYEMNNHVVEYEQDRRTGGARGLPRASSRRPGQYGAISLGPPMELSVDSRWRRCDPRDRDLRLLASARRGACSDGQREGVG